MTDDQDNEDDSKHAVLDWSRLFSLPLNSRDTPDLTHLQRFLEIEGELFLDLLTALRISEDIPLDLDFHRTMEESFDRDSHLSRNDNRVQLYIQPIKCTEKSFCSICQSNCDLNQFIYRLECSHVFHTNCLDEWLRYKTECPLCRSTLRAIVPAREVDSDETYMPSSDSSDGSDSLDSSDSDTMYETDSSIER